MCYGYTKCYGRVIINEADSYPGDAVYEYQDFATYRHLAREMAAILGPGMVLLVYRHEKEPPSHISFPDDVIKWWDAGDADTMHVDEFVSRRSELMPRYTTILSPAYSHGAGVKEDEGAAALTPEVVLDWIRLGCRRFIIGAEYPAPFGGFGTGWDWMIKNVNQFLEELGSTIRGGLEQRPGDDWDSGEDPADDPTYVETYGRGVLQSDFGQLIADYKSWYDIKKLDPTVPDFEINNYLNGSVSDPMFCCEGSTALFFSNCGTYTGGDKALWDGGGWAPFADEDGFVWYEWMRPLDSTPAVVIEELEGSEVIVFGDANPFGVETAISGSPGDGQGLPGVLTADRWVEFCRQPGPYDKARGRIR